LRKRVDCWGRAPAWRNAEVAAAKRTPSGMCPAEGGDRAAGFRASGIPLANKRCSCGRAADAFRDVPRRRRGSSGGIFALAESRSRTSGAVAAAQRTPSGVCPAVGGIERRDSR
jgi:hypothetical protein